MLVEIYTRGNGRVIGYVIASSEVFHSPFTRAPQPNLTARVIAVSNIPGSDGIRSLRDRLRRSKLK